MIGEEQADAPHRARDRGDMRISLRAFGAAALLAASAGTSLAQGEAPATGLMSAAELAQRLKAALGAYGELFQSIGRIPGLLDASAEGGSGAGWFLILLLVGVAALLGVERGVLAALAPLRRRYAARLGAGNPYGWLALIAGLDAAALAALWIAAQVLANAGFAANESQIRLAGLAFTALYFWRLYLLVFRLWLRPELPQARLVPVGDADAGTIYFWLAVWTALPLIGGVWLPFLLSIPVPRAAGQAAMLPNGIIFMALFAYCILAARHAVARWLGALVGPGAGRALKLEAAHYWWVAGLAIVVVQWLAQANGVLSGRTTVIYGLVRTQTLIFLLLLAETLIWHAQQRKTAADATGEPRAVDLVARCLRLAARLYFIIALAQIWVVDVLALVSPAQWEKQQAGLAAAGLALYAAYVIWHVAKYRIDLYLARNKVAATGFAADGAADAEGDDDAPPPTASRLRTLMPLLRVVLATVIIVLAGLIALSELGVNITPLIAGASILGLAISFGSQSLVKDIVSGVFYLAEDAFRVGEYIDSGKAKGIVEGFSIRSVRLRHQNGQLHIVPFGQLGSITNFSRDWTTVKFNLPMARSTDIEALRKATKKVGQEMMGDPLIAKDVLVPLKMQGIADIRENALVVRFKFTAKPTNPSYIQRQAVKRMYEAFPKKGLRFADATVSVQSVGGAVADAAAAARAAAPVPARGEAEA
jgi:small-conductance mechanosensitive channel